MKRILLLIAGLVAGAGLALPLTASPATAPTSNALAGGQSTSVSCAGVSISVTPQSATAITAVCNAAPTTPTTQPPATTTTQPPATTTTTTPPTQPPTTGAALLGLYNNGTPKSQLGLSHIDVTSDYAYGNNSTTYAASGAQAAKGTTLELAVGVLTTSQAQAIANILVQNGQANAIIRPMWEPNQGGWFTAWNEKTLSAAQYKADFITDVDGFRSVAGQSFRFVYNLTAGTSSNIAGRFNFDSFPGTQYVDTIGIDVYDNNGSVAASQNDIVADATYAQQVGLPWSIPEWGMYASDDPAFVHQIYLDSQLSTCNGEALFSAPFYAPGSSGAGLTDTTKSGQPAFPNSLAEYKADFGN